MSQFREDFLALKINVKFDGCTALPLPSLNGLDHGEGGWWNDPLDDQGVAGGYMEVASAARKV